MNSQTRRKLLGVLGQSALYVLTLSLVRTPRAQARIDAEVDAQATPPAGDALARYQDITDDPLLSEASEWVERLHSQGTTVLVYPVSRLQREFHLGYSRACGLAEQLAQRGLWTVGYDNDGIRRARIHRVTLEE